MFKLNEKCEIDRRFSKSDYIRYSPAEKKSNANSQKYINTPREVFVISLTKSYPDLNFEVIRRADTSRCANGNHVGLVNLGPIASFSNYNVDDV